jgi:drug/metabolite transporter (DMT)-like permease
MAARSTRTLVVLAFFAVCVVWGSTYFAIRVALEGFPPFVGGGIRFVLAGSILYVLLRARGERAPTAIEWRGAAVTGVLFFVFSNGFVILAEQSVSSGLVSVLVAAMPLWATLFERLAGIRVRGLEWIGIALGMSGVAVLNLGGELRASGLGALFGMIAPMSWALGSVVSKRLVLPKGTMCTAAQMLCGGVAMGITSAPLGEHFEHPPSARAIVALAYLVAFGSLIGFTAYMYLLHHTRMSVATSYAYVNPIIALGLGVAFGGERIDRASGIGAVIILAAVVLITRAKATVAPKESHEEPLAAAETSG